MRAWVRILRSPNQEGYRPGQKFYDFTRGIHRECNLCADVVERATTFVK